MEYNFKKQFWVEAVAILGLIASIMTLYFSLLY